MPDTPHPEFGVPWAADGETRPSQFCTPLAWVEGDRGGVLFVRFGPSSDDERWVTMKAWNRWVKDCKAKPVVPDPPDDDAINPSADDE
jgi:hypothetical protein